MEKNNTSTVKSMFCWLGIAVALFLSGCNHHVSPEPLFASATSGQNNVKVHWYKPELLYINASWYNSGPLDYTINSDGTLDPPLTRYDLDNNAPSVSDRNGTGIAGLTVSPDHHSIYFGRIERDEPFNRVGRYCIGRKVNLQFQQVFTEGSNTDSLKSIAFTGQGRFLYALYDRYNASYNTNRPAVSRYVLVAYRIGVGGRVERLPGPPILAATYMTAAFVANPLIVVARAISGPSVRFLYVLRPEDHHLDVYHIKPSGMILTPPAMTLPLGYQPGGAVFLPNGHILYVADADRGFLRTYRIAANGMPVLLSGTVQGIDPALDPEGHFLYATPRWGRTLFCYVVLSDGTLRLQGTTPTRAICNTPCVDTTGRFVYTLGQDPVQLDEHVISQFRITKNGVLVPLQPECVPALSCTTLVVAQ